MIKSISTAIGNVFSFFSKREGNLSKRQLYHRIKKLEAAVEAAEHYIRVNNKSGEYKKITNKRKEQLLRHFSKRYFHYN